ncbi:MAG: helix-turn-helix transcriptional regulator [Spirochaetia bacterium]|nr:helix-turn-helix transcriptional regulator [Spirochaetia bacterium]
MKDSSVPTWRLPLAERPQIAAIGWGVHGREKREEVYYLKGLWCAHLYDYSARIRVGGVLVDIRPGDLSIFPPDQKMVYYYQGVSRHIYAHFRFSEKIGASHPIRAVQPLHDTWAGSRNAMEIALDHFGTEPLRAEVKLWDLLWEWAARSAHSSDEKAPVHPALRVLVGRIETGLGEDLKVASLVRNCGLSHNHMIRLFQKTFQTTIEGYIRSRRLSRASHLLRNSTFPIKQIASEVGIRDPQQFNKLVRRAFGKSPRALRFQF